MTTIKKHISYSELRIHSECPYKWYLQYVKNISGFTGNVYTAFGTAIHSVCEQSALKKLELEDFPLHFDKEFLVELMKLDEKPKNKMIVDMREQSRGIFDKIAPALEEMFPGYEVYSSEEAIYEPITELKFERFLKGFIDVVLKTPDGKYHILDWKSCSWGWDAKKKADKMVGYQLTLYKKFFCEKHDIEPELVETYFGLLKRTAKKDQVEIFRVTSGPRKVTNATKLLTNACRLINKGVKIKNRGSCTRCPFNNTEHCKR
jgi:hypothetical protein|tara:strand:+ start:432 stop:1214 length:783 start_codon:yes stop_codon:yes gene_type:complete